MMKGGETMKGDLSKSEEELVKRGLMLKDNGQIEGFNANYFADYIKTKLQIIYGMDGFFYIYSNGVWEKFNDDTILKMLREILQEPMFGVWRKRQADEYVIALKRELYHTSEMNPHRYIITQTTSF
jgi:hypothetical protein